MKKYLEMKKRHSEEFNKFPMFAAFSDKQFSEGMKKLGLDSSERDKIYNLGSGLFIRKTDSKAFSIMFKKHEAELKEAYKDYDFAIGMFNYELGNHEYTYTWDVTDTLNALDISKDDIKSNDILKRALEAAIILQQQEEDI